MRPMLRSFTLLSLLAVPAMVFAQDTTPKTPPDQSGPSATQPAAATNPIKEGAVNFGVIGSDVSGDTARFNRFRDLSNGAYFDGFRTRVEAFGWFMDFGADHIGRQDQRYTGLFVRPGQIKVNFMWDQIRELVSNDTRSLFTQVTPGVLRVDDNVQTALQAAGPVAQGGNNTLSSALPATLNNFNLPFELGTRRHSATGGFEYLPDANTTVKFDVDHTNRTGAILYSGMFGFSNAVDIPQPISQHTTTASMSYERQLGDVLVRGGFLGSYFRNDDSIITWDNPYRLTDLASLSSQGRTFVAPSNNWNDVNGMVSVKVPAHSRAMAAVSFGFLNDDGAPIIPMTINTALPVIALERNVVGGNAHTRNATLGFTSRPVKQINYELRYRYSDYNNLTAVFDNNYVGGSQQRIQYDSSLQTATVTGECATTTAGCLASMETARFGGSKQTFSADLHYVAPFGHSVGVGYARNTATYEDRIYAGSHEDVWHVSLDLLQTRFVSVHTKYEHGIRRGTGLDTTELVNDGEQSTIRTYDIADRNRDLFSVAASIFPINSVSFELSAGTGKDRYPTTNFGVTSADHFVYGAAVEVDPNEHVSLNLSYTFDDFKSGQWSRNASSPPPAAVFFDPSKDWSDSAHDYTRDLSAALSFLNMAKTDVRLRFDSSMGRGSYIYGTGSAPLDAVVATTLPTPVQLPGLVSDLKSASIDVIYHLTPRLGAGFGYFYEQFNVADLALDSRALPAFNLATTDILMGYQYQPFTARTFFGRLIVHW